MKEEKCSDNLYYEFRREEKKIERIRIEKKEVKL
jgi:hypothetical protein